MTNKLRVAILKHQRNTNANLLWGPHLSLELDLRVDESCKGLRSLGYFASAFPEKDGVTISHPAYSPEVALADVRSKFPWLDITDESMRVSSLYGDEAVECTILSLSKNSISPVF
jgi:hypothetical protein